MSRRYEMNKVSVLIVESNKSVIDHLSNKFSDMGLSVITALDGFEGYVRACNEMPNYIIAAGVLPSVNGFKLSLLLKKDEKYKHIHISLLTSNNIEDENNPFLQSGADKILQKPFKFSQLLNEMSLTNKV
tara:strand:+ start:343 stop:732 length:390 start_codon:yes stop_codon:yes gene_type:complete